MLLVGYDFCLEIVSLPVYTEIATDIEIQTEIPTVCRNRHGAPSLVVDDALIIYYHLRTVTKTRTDGYREIADLL